MRFFSGTAMLSLCKFDGNDHVPVPLLRLHAAKGRPGLHNACRRLTWESATQRLLEAATIRADEWPSTTEKVADLGIWNFYRPFAWIEILSRVSEARHAPAYYCT